MSVCTTCNLALHFTPNGTNCMCLSGYFFNTTTTTCISCSQFSSNCLTCSADGCVTCAENYVVDGKNCSLKCNISVCLSCANSTTCEFCGPFSKISDDKQTCPCKTGYYMNGNHCSSCGETLPNCTECLTASSCVECSAGFRLNLETLNCEVFESILKVALMLLVLVATIFSL